jgi:hypothetical protein
MVSSIGCQSPSMAKGGWGKEDLDPPLGHRNHARSSSHSLPGLHLLVLLPCSSLHERTADHQPSLASQTYSKLDLDEVLPRWHSLFGRLELAPQPILEDGASWVTLPLRPILARQPVD